MPPIASVGGNGAFMHDLDGEIAAASTALVANGGDGDLDPRA